MIRKAVADIHRRVKFYLEKFPSKGMVEILSLVVLNIGIQNCGLQKQVESAIVSRLVLI